MDEFRKIYTYLQTYLPSWLEKQRGVLYDAASEDINEWLESEDLYEDVKLVPGLLDEL